VIRIAPYRIAVLALALAFVAASAGCKREEGHGTVAAVSQTAATGVAPTAAPSGSGVARVHRTFSYDFQIDLTSAQVFARLNESGPWSWTMRSSDGKGEYMSTRALPEYAMVKLYRLPDHGHVDLRCQAEGPDAARECDRIRQALVERVLPGVGARDIKDGSSLE
jgi:hypothetical protein